MGYGDDYAATLEGQYLRLTGLASGRYVLVHRVNVECRLRELRYGTTRRRCCSGCAGASTGPWCACSGLLRHRTLRPAAGCAPR